MEDRPTKPIGALAEVPRSHRPTQGIEEQALAAAGGAQREQGSVLKRIKEETHPCSHPHAIHQPQDKDIIKGTRASLLCDFLSATLDSRKQWSKAFKVSRKKLYTVLN